MKRIYIILIMLVCFIGGAQAQDMDGAFEKGNNLYTKGSYKAAAEQYQKIIDAGYSSSKLFYNAGNAYYKQKLYAKAILCYERAYRLSPSDAAINHNLELARLQIKDKVEPVPTFFVVEWLSAIRSWLSANGWAWLSITSLLVCGLLFVAYRFTGTLITKKIAFSSSSFFMLLFLFSVWNASVQTKKITEPNTAIVLSPVVVVKSSPDENGKELFIVHEGTKLTFTETPPVEGWTEVRIADGNTGWIQNSTFEII